MEGRLNSRLLKGTCTTSNNEYTEIICDFNPSHVVLINPSKQLVFWDENFGDYFYFGGEKRAFVDKPNSYSASFVKVSGNIIYIGLYNTGVVQTWNYYIYE